MKYHITKKNIEELANFIAKQLIKLHLYNGVSIYYNNNRMKVLPDENGVPSIAIVENIDPHKYVEYAAYHHILTMSFDGDLYDYYHYVHGTFPKLIENRLEKMGLYYEFGRSYDISLFPSHEEDDGSVIEYTEYKKPIEPIFVHWRNAEETPFYDIMKEWRESALKVGDSGSCVIGAGFRFTYDGTPYFMSPPSPYQGSLSWEEGKDTIESMLKDIGCTDIYYDWGRMD